jgi:DNA polymerase-1
VTHVILIDARNALYRFGFVNRTLQSSKGVKTGAVYGLLNCLLRLKRKYRDSWFVMVWDGTGKTWRHELFPGYKGNRPGTKSPEVLAVLEQIPIVKELTTMLGVPQVEVDNMEADDAIGILATQCVRQNWTPVVYSSDKDFLQLMPKGVLVIRDVDKTNRLLPETERTVYQMFGCYSANVLKVRALCGDPSDGIPNIKRGIGIKTAVKLINAGFDPSLPPPPGDKEKEIAYRNYKLMQIATEKGNLLHKAVGEVFRTRRDLRHSLRDVTARLGELDMVTALENRHELWKLQNCSP